MAKLVKSECGIRFRLREPGATAQTPIICYIEYNGKPVIKVPTGLRIKPALWLSDKEKPLSGIKGLKSAEAHIFNSRISGIRHLIETAYRDHILKFDEYPDKVKFKEHLLRILRGEPDNDVPEPKDPCFVNFMSSQILLAKAGGRVKISGRGKGSRFSDETIRDHEGTVNLIRRFLESLEKKTICFDEVESNIKAMGARVVSVQADISKVAEIQRLFAAAKAAFGKIDIVVANAGIEMVETPVVEFTEEQFDKLFAINTKGSYFTMQLAAREIEDNGRIIYIASSTTAFPVPGMAVYGGSKMTPRYMVDILAKEIGYRGVTVNSIIPFAVDHSGIFVDEHAYPRLRKQLLESCPMGRLAEVEDVANVAEFFASGLSSFVNGQHLLVNGGATN